MQIEVNLGRLENLIVFNQLTRAFSFKEKVDSIYGIEEGQYELAIRLSDSNNETNDYLLKFSVSFAEPEPE